MAFAPAEDLKTLYFMTTRNTRKFRNLMKKDRVSLLVDDRHNVPEDLHLAVAVTILGTVTECRGPEREKGLALFLDRHPYLTEFAGSPSGALLKVCVETYLFVSRFQNVVEVHIDETACNPSV